MVDIFDEVEEELRADKAKQLLRRYSVLIISACVIVVVSVAGWQGWRYWQARQNSAAAIAYLAGMSRIDNLPLVSDERRKQALADLQALTTSGPPGYRSLSRLQAAALKADSDDLPGASLLWDQVAADSGTDPLLRDLASVLWASRHLASADPSVLEARLLPLTAPGNVWRGLAREQLALLMLRREKLDDAKAELTKLAEDATAPAGVRDRSRALLDQLRR